MPERARARRSSLRAFAGHALLAAALFVFAAPRAHAQAAVRLDGLAAVVGGDAPGAGVDAILQSDVVLRARIAWSARESGDPAHDPLPSSLLAAALQEIIGEHLIAREAKRVQAATPTSADVERELRRLYKTAGGAERMQALLAAIGAAADELEQVARRRALVGAFLSANLEGVTVVTDAEVERAYASEQEKFAGRDRDTVLGELRSQLSRAALDRTIERWVAVLATRTPVRVYVSY